MTISERILKDGSHIPAYGTGTWTLGGEYRNRDTSHDAAAINSLRHAISLGVTHFDTAEMYGAGHAEELLGHAIKGHREELFIATKVLSPHLKREDRNGIKGIRTTAEESLRRLNTDYVDLMYVHAADADVPIEDTMAGMNELVDAGKILRIGVSNFTTKALKTAQQYSDHPIVANQIHYSLRFREPETDRLLIHCQQTGVIPVFWSPILGVFKEGHEIPTVVREMQEKYDLTPEQVAIKYALAQNDNQAVVLATTKQLGHLQDNLRAVSLPPLQNEDVERLRREFPSEALSDQYGLGDVRTAQEIETGAKYRVGDVDIRGAIEMKEGIPYEVIFSSFA